VTRIERLFLIDGTSYSYRAFYAIRHLSTSQGLPTNAVYGFLLMLRRLLETETPDGVAVAFDLKEPTFRHEQYREYKRRRKPMPEPLVEQLPMIKELLAGYRIPIYECPGYEADDLLGTLARQAVAQGIEVYLATEDKDACQLVGPRVKVYRWEGDVGVVIGEDQVQERWGVPPARLVDVMALAGDATDDIAGVPGIGPKRAAELVRQHGSLDQLLAHLESLEPAARRRLLEEHRDRIAMNRSLVTIRADVPVTLDVSAARRQVPDDARLHTLFRAWEFKRLIQEVAPAVAGTAAWRRVAEGPAASALVEAVRRAGTMTLHPVWQGPDPCSLLAGCAVASRRDDLAYVDFTCPGVIEALTPVLTDPAVTKVGHDLKALRQGLARLGIDLRGDAFDTMVAAYLVDPSKGHYPLEDLALDYAETPIPPPASVEPAVQVAQVLWPLHSALTGALEARGLTRLYREVEHPLIRVLAAMESAGVAVDVSVFASLATTIHQTLERLTGEIYEMAGRPFNINSPKQLSELLFRELKLPIIKRTKTGASTDEEVLQRLAAQHALPATLLQYRELAKLASTYVEALPALVSPETGRIHTSFNQTATATGRLSSSTPNLQNIPVRTEIGRQIRRAFVSRWPDGHVLAADYSQIELRVLAHLSGDEALCEAFHQGQDVHRVTAAQVFRVTPEAVTEAQRAVAKTINFGIIYGMTPFGLSKELGIDVGQAEAFITHYFHRYPTVKAYLERSLEETRRLGYCTTLFGRRRYIPQLADERQTVRQFAERTAINAPIQGSAADLIKVAMIRIHDALGRRRLRSLMVMQVHDELVFDVPSGELEDVRALAREQMTAAASLTVPIQVHVNAGRNWLEASHGA